MQGFIFHATGQPDHHVQTHLFQQALPHWEDMSVRELQHRAQSTQVHVAIMAHNALVTRKCIGP